MPAGLSPLEKRISYPITAGAPVLSLLRDLRSLGCVVGPAFSGTARVEIIKSLRHHPGETPQGDQVGQHHQTVEHVRQLPHKVDLKEGAQHDEAHDEHAENRQPVHSEEKLDVLLGEEIPANDR